MFKNQCSLANVRAGALVVAKPLLVLVVCFFAVLGLLLVMTIANAWWAGNPVGLATSMAAISIFSLSGLSMLGSCAWLLYRNWRYTLVGLALVVVADAVIFEVMAYRKWVGSLIPGIYDNPLNVFLVGRLSGIARLELVPAQIVVFGFCLISIAVVIGIVLFALSELCLAGAIARAEKLS